jgi:hypothetical protein
MCNFVVSNNDLKNKQMIVDTIDLDDKKVKQKEMCYQKSGVRFENTVVNDVIPEGYMTVEQFRTEAKTSLTKLLNEHGIY